MDSKDVRFAILRFLICDLVPVLLSQSFSGSFISNQQSAIKNQF
jgi:hypothetical protein